MSHENPFQNHFDGDSPRHSSAYYAQRTSALAILSLIFGLLSVPLMCLIVPAIPFSLGAIVMGHMSRGVVRDTNGQYRGMEMGTFGLLLGYSTLSLTAVAFLLMATWSVQTAPRIVNQTVSSEIVHNVLVQQAETQLLSDSQQTTFGVTTCTHSATQVAQHYVDSLQVLDSTYFAETETDEELPPRAYRTFVQLNEDSAAFLLCVPEYHRFTEEARQTLIASSWLIAQRSVDDVLPTNSSLAVALYSENGRQQIMVGTTSHTESKKTTPKKQNASPRDLSRFFRVARPTRKKGKSSTVPETTSEIDTKPISEIPAEVE